jgi:coenzyme F420-0:L-glutamate ligase / coenzyme F420-1:gamma-L-glutamate ligase
MKSRPYPGELQIIPLFLDTEIRRGDSIADQLAAVTQHQKLAFASGDILVVKHKIVSKAEGQTVNLENMRPSASSRAWARRYSLDARVVEVALRESKRIVRSKRGVLITETQHGFVCANSGVDVSNVDGGRTALLLPRDPDASAALIHRQIKRRFGIFVPVIISDSFGRPWREGLTEVAIGISGMKPLRDYRKQTDPHEYTLRASIEAIADELACAAGLVCGKLNRTPACIVRGYRYERGRGRAQDLIRPAANDLFR